MLETVRKEIEDMGVAAYLMMHGYKVISKSQRKGVVFVFEVEKSGFQEFEDREFEYCQSEFQKFDNCLVTLKKMGYRMSELSR